MKKEIKILVLGVTIFLLSISISIAQGLFQISLNGNWQLYYGLFDKNAPATPAELRNINWPEISATVPGNVELELFSAGEIENPETGNNIYDLRKYEAYQWWYYREFDSPHLKTGEQIDIIFEGIDCFGSIWINDHLIGETDNMLIEHRFNITDLLKQEGKNSIYICIDPAVAQVQKYIIGTIGSRMNFSSEQTNIRKAPHMYGWDIMPRLISAGLWRGVNLEVKKPSRFEQVYWMTNSVNLPDQTANLILDWQLSTDYPTVDGLTLEVSIAEKGKTVYENSYPLLSFCGRQRIGLNNVNFWWPRGYGEPSW